MQIADALQAAVAEGGLKPGDRLPPQRQLAAQLDVDMTTITRAYDEARRSIPNEKFISVAFSKFAVYIRLYVKTQTC